MVAAPTAFAADDPAVDPNAPACVAADGSDCQDPGGTNSEDPSTGGDNQGDTPGDSGDSGDNPGDSGDTPSDGGDGSGSDSSGDDSTPDDPTGDNPGGDKPDDNGGGSDDGGDQPIDLCTWEPWNCNGGDPTDPPRCEPTANGTKICHIDPPVEPPVEPECKTDPDTGEVYCWQPPDVCLVSRFASEADAAAAGCLPPPCTVAEDGTADCGDPVGPICPDCDNPYPPPFCDYADGAGGGFYCGGPPPCFIDDEGNKICAVYDMAPGTKGGVKGGKGTKRKDANKGKGSGKPAKGSKGKGAKNGKGSKKHKGNGKGKKSKKSGAKKPKRSAKR